MTDALEKAHKILAYKHEVTWHDEKQKKYAELCRKSAMDIAEALAEAHEVIEFYGHEESWRFTFSKKDSLVVYCAVDHMDREVTGRNEFGGKLEYGGKAARHWLEKWSGDDD